jgi:hypothetical protein
MFFSSFLLLIKLFISAYFMVEYCAVYYQLDQLGLSTI